MNQSKPWLNPWVSPWWNVFKAPLSGNVTQDINPVTSWLSPTFEFNFAGNRQTESRVVSEVASYGTQLGKLSEAVLELANGEKGEAIAALEQLVAQIEEVKNQQPDSQEAVLKQGLDALKASNPDAFEQLISEYR